LRRQAQRRVPQEQTCCGQPMASSGCDAAARPWPNVFPPRSASAVSLGKLRVDGAQPLRSLASRRFRFEHLRDHTFGLCDCLTDIAKVVTVDGEFPSKSESR
jgi:L-lactate dehydrogenase complex protein LldE